MRRMSKSETTMASAPAIGAIQKTDGEVKTGIPKTDCRGSKS
jgi:hypothetical protein